MSSYAEGHVSDGCGSRDESCAAPSAIALAEMIEAHIIPQLMVAHRLDRYVPLQCRPVAADPGGADVASFARAAIRSDVDDLLDRVATYAARGATVEGVFLDLLAPAARELGVMWERDTATFADVTIALSRIHAVVHALAATHPVHHPAAFSARRIMLAAPPGEQHTLGLTMLGELFRRDGWSVSVETPQTTADLARMVRDEHVDVLGLSIGAAEVATRVPALLAAVRRAARNPALKVVAGGPWCLAAGPEADQLGADAVVREADKAVATVRSLLTEARIHT